MQRLVTWLVLTGFLGFLVPSSLAASARQTHAFQAAQEAFDAGLWSRADSGFSAYVARYPQAANVAMALLLQAEAEIKLGQFTNAIQLLGANQSRSGDLADQFLNCMGQAQYAAGDFLSAADSYSALMLNYTNSPLRLTAAVSAATAWGQLGQWSQALLFLEAPGGVFFNALQENPNGVLVLRGNLLRAQALFEVGSYAEAVAILRQHKPGELPQDLSWPWSYWSGRSQAAMGSFPEALASANQMVELAGDAGDPARLASSLEFRAELYEKTGQTNAALGDYEANLTHLGVPAENQREAVAKVAQLLVQQNDFATAEDRLTSFLTGFSNSPAAPAAMFTLGDIHLRDYGYSSAVTNLELAQQCFDQFLSSYPDSQYRGHAFLDRGWCGWLGGNAAAAAADFQSATTILPHSFDLAVARFKLGDAFYALHDYTNALKNYQSVVDDFAGDAKVVNTLDEAALYQSLRVSEAMNDGTSASRSLARILKMFPSGDLSDNAILLYGENEAALGRPESARDLFSRFLTQFPHSELLPQAELAVARTYEQQSDWNSALQRYEQWLKAFPDNELTPTALYACARAYYQNGDDTNALRQFNQFMLDFPTNSLAPQAQWWVADYFYRQGNFAGAETNYENIFQNSAWRNSALIYPAQFMAGRAAMARNGYPDATRYLGSLISDTNCPPDLGITARFACAAAWMQIPSPDTNNPGANYGTALSLLGQVIQINATNSDAARAWGEIGDCNLQMNNLSAAESAYEQVFDSNAPAALFAAVPTRCAAMVASGLVFEKRADSALGVEKTNLLQSALNRYLDVFDTNVGKNLFEGEQADPFWVKKAGLQALPLIQLLHQGNADDFLNQLEKLLPALKPSLEHLRSNLNHQT